MRKLPLFGIVVLVVACGGGGGGGGSGGNPTSPPALNATIVFCAFNANVSAVSVGLDGSISVTWTGGNASGDLDGSACYETPVFPGGTTAGEQDPGVPHGW